MKDAPKTIQGNGLLDVLLKGLKLNGDYNEGALKVLAQVSKLYEQRLKKRFIWEPVLEEDAVHLGLRYTEMLEINKLVKEIGFEYPAHQPSTDSQWDHIEAFPKELKKCLIDLHARVPNIVAHARALWRHTSDRHDLLAWLEALHHLHQSGNDEPDLFHGLFLNNHDFAQRAYELAMAPLSTLRYSTIVLRALAECRFSSLTMNSAKLNDLFTSLANYINTRQKDERHYDRTFDDWQDAYISEDDIKAIIKDKYYPKSLLWRSVQEPQPTPSDSQNASLAVSSVLSSSDSLSRPSSKRKRNTYT